MRVTFIPPTEEEFKTLFQSTPLRRGGGLEDISIFYPGRRRGGSILSTLSGLARKVLPFLFKAVTPSAKEFGKRVITDMVTKERPLKESLKKHGIEAAKSTGLRILNGSGKIRKREKRNNIRRNVRQQQQQQRFLPLKNDVYELL